MSREISQVPWDLRPVPLTPKEVAEQSALCAELPLLAYRLGQVGLYRTMHKLNEAIHALGFEVAEERKRRGFR